MCKMLNKNRQILLNYSELIEKRMRQCTPNHLLKLIALSIIWVINMGMLYEDLLETLSAIALVCFTTVFWLRNTQNA